MKNMKTKYDLHRLSFVMIFLCLAAILVFLGVLCEGVASAEIGMRAVILQNAYLALERCMMALLLTAIGGFALELVIRRIDFDLDTKN